MAVLLLGDEDEDVIDHFIATAFPAEDDLRQLLDGLEDTPEGLTVAELAAQLALPARTVRHGLRFLAAADPAPVACRGDRWWRTDQDYRLEPERRAIVTRRRRDDWDAMRAYAETEGCLMRFIVTALGDDDAAACGRCANCTGRPILPPRPSPRLRRQAAAFLEGRPDSAGRGALAWLRGWLLGR
jgi:ATP-dependent DNA helicase RecQ